MSAEEKWKRFMDMHSGGGMVVPPYEYIYIKANDYDDAIEIFKRELNEDPETDGCECCGDIYWITSDAPSEPDFRDDEVLIIE